ncbi:nuclear exosome regulator NRDE2 [Ciona intestinalis]
MSLFPSASALASASNNDKDEEWLQNKSFKKDAAEALRKHQESLKEEPTDEFKEESPMVYSDHSSNHESGSGSEQEEYQPIEVKHEVDSSDTIFVDKASDKNNLYFGKPYRVPIPKFYRCVDSCIGLPKHMQIIFKTKKKRKRKYVATDPRYFHKTMGDDDDTVEVTEDPFKTQTEILNIETRENPTNIEAWMELAQLQDRTHGKRVKFANEKKVSILNKAIAANPKNVDLKLKRLSFLENISEDSDREWKNLVFQHPGDRRAWEAYIGHTMSGASFKVHRTLKAFEKCIQTLSSLRFQSFQTEETAAKTELDLLEIFEKLVEYFIESGLVERCVLLLVLLMEVNLRTCSCSSVEEVKLFYESGEAILGEKKSSGWKIWSEKHQKGGWSSVVEEEEEEEFVDDLDVDPDLDLTHNWLVMEATRGKRDIYPWRLKQECEDVGRKVSFEDIKGFIFFTKKVSSRLRFLRLFVKTLGARNENVLERNFLLSQPCHLTHALHSTGTLGDISQLKFNCGTQCTDTVLPRSPHHELLCLVLEQLCSNCPTDVKKGVAEIGMDYFVIRATELSKCQGKKAELKKTGKEAKKFAKMALKMDPLNFVVWGKLARVEFLTGKADDSLKIYQNSLCTCKQQEDALVLCVSYIESFYDSKPESVKPILAALGDGLNFKEVFQKPEKVTGAMLLRGGRGLERLCEDMACLYPSVCCSEKGDLSQFANTLCCHAVFLALSFSTNVDKTLKQYISVIRKEYNSGNTQAAMDLKYIHNLRLRLISPCIVRSTSYRNAVLYALDDFPDCPEFSLKLCQLEVGSAITSTARKLFSPATSIAAAFYSIYFELLSHQRTAVHGNYVNPSRVINLLERAVTKHNHSVLLWRLLVHFSKGSENVLTRAIFACPWSKSIACDQIRFKPDKISDVIKNMLDVGIRIRTPIEEVQLLLAM